jgi:hypothetical protein
LEISLDIFTTADSQPKRRVQKPASDSELSEDDTPLSAKKPAARKSTNGRAKARPKYSESEESESEDEKPLAKKKAAAKPRASTSSVKKAKKEESDSEDEKPLAKKANGAAKGKATAKEEKKPVVKREKKVKEYVIFTRPGARLTNAEKRKISTNGGNREKTMDQPNGPPYITTVSYSHRHISHYRRTSR